MTFCLGIAVEDGLIGIADTRITSGTELSSSRKLVMHGSEGNTLFLMTSGLRSTRDKTVMYFDEYMREKSGGFDKLYKAVNAYCEQVRRVADEDQSALSRSGMFFDLHTLIGGRFENDDSHKLYLVYPQANWIEVSRDTPYCIIGRSSYGKPLLDRTLTYQTNLETALNIGFLAFDATCTSVNEVDFPIDVAVFRNETRTLSEHRFGEQDLLRVSEWWHRRLSELVSEAPPDLTSVFFPKAGASAR
ncbi:MAG: peptidase [Blastocatellia bacterium]|nr:peptidase [Blastocatellia bacterium]